MDTNTLGYICLVDFNRIEFGSALWNSVHGCLISFHSSAAHKDSLESHQYQAASQCYYLH